MSRQHEPQLTFATIYSSPDINVSDFNCRACRGGPAAEEYVEDHKIVLLRHGVFRKHIGRRSLTADVNQAVFFSKGSTYRVSHPLDCGDRGTVFTLAPHVLTDLLGEIDPTYLDRPDRPFPFAAGPCDTKVFWIHRQLVGRLESAAAGLLDSMWVDETTLQLMEKVLGAAFARQDKPKRNRRENTLEDHRDRAEAAKTYLASRMGESVTLDEVARHVGASPYHLSRLFRDYTGVPVHRYLTRMRLRASIELLAEGGDNLTDLALELGFSSHSHFTDTFRREFGRTPSDVRRAIGRGSLPEMGKNPEA